MIRLSISHAIAQSVKISLFEELVNETIDATKDTPQMIAETGRVNLKREEIMMAVGQLFILRININLQGSVLDSPELMWTEPQLEPIYTAARSYLEINQRVALLNQRVEVIGDLLSMLKEQITHTHDESLEWIVVILMGLLVLIALFSIVVRLADGFKLNDFRLVINNSNKFILLFANTLFYIGGLEAVSITTEESFLFLHYVYIIEEMGKGKKIKPYLSS